MGGYPPQMGGYPPQMGGYPPQMGKTFHTYQRNSFKNSTLNKI